MNFNPSPIQALYLLRLAAHGGEAFLKNMKPALETAARKELMRNDLTNESAQLPKNGKRKCLQVSLTDQGWIWCTEHMDTPLPPRAGSSALDLATPLLKRLKMHFQATSISLADFILSTPIKEEKPETVKEVEVEEQATPPQVNGTGLEAQIKTAYLDLSEGKFDVRVRLKDLRKELDQTPQEELDQTLLRLDSEQQIVLYPLDNPRERTPEDDNAAVINSLGIPRHILYMRGNAS